MKFVFSMVAILLVSACIPDKPEERKSDSLIQQEMNLHKQRMQGFGHMDTPAQDGAFGRK